MYLTIKFQGRKSSESRVLGDLSKTMAVADFVKRIEKEFERDPSLNLLLMCRGKILRSGTLFDYGININDTVQVYEREVPSESASTSASSEKGAEKPDTESAEEILEDAESSTFRIGDLVDVRDVEENSPTAGAYFEAKIRRITRAIQPQDKEEEEEEGDGLNYHVVYDKYPLDDTDHKSSIANLLYRARVLVQLKDLSVGDEILVSYNQEDPADRGEWFRAVVERVDPKAKKLVCKVMLGVSGCILSGVAIKRLDAIFLVEKLQPLDECTPAQEKARRIPVARIHPFDCEECQDMKKRKCKSCGCAVCGKKDREEVQVICSQCTLAYHIECINLPSVPVEDDFFCPDCKTVDTTIKEGVELKLGKKAAKMASRVNQQKRDWGKGFATAGRTKVNHQVPVDYKGKIPGTEVGMSWIYRLQVSEVGIHRPHVAGIHASEGGCMSIVLSGGYEDDVDNGDEFTYTGSGGRDLDGNKRTAEQSSDQQLTKANKGMAANCNTPLNKTGGEASDWKKGIPIRVVRGAKAKKHSKYAPQEGFRYDGIYKVVKYYPEKGKSGFLVWKYLLRRDDPEPAPWHKGGKTFPVIYPENYEKVMSNKKSAAKRKANNHENEDPNLPQKRHAEEYKIEKSVIEAMKADKKNAKVWTELLKGKYKTSLEFTTAVEESFSCIICTCLIFEPITTDCRHNLCGGCVKHTLKSEVTSCVVCRTPFDAKTIMKKTNNELRVALVKIFPGYEIGR